MKILHIIPTLNKGGAERLVVDICNEINSRDNYEAKILLLHDENSFTNSLKNTGVILCRSAFKFRVLGKSEGNMGQYEEVVKKFSPDIIHSHLFEAEFFSREMLFTGATYFTHLHDNMVQFLPMRAVDFFDRKKLMNFFEKKHLVRNYRRCNNYFLANSSHTENYFRKSLPPDLSKNLSHQLNAIDLSEFSFLKRTLTSNEIRLINTGSLVEKKNQTLLLDVVDILKKRNCNVHLTLLGDGPLRSRLEQKAALMGITGHVSFEGNVNDVAVQLADANLYVHSATYEPFGLAIVEALATGLPVIALDGGGNREIMQDGREGFLITESSADLFADKILQVMKDDLTYQRFVKSAYETAQQFSIESYVDSLIALYKSALNDR